MKPMINLIMIGDVDHGKSTLAGRILSDLGFVSKKDFERVKKHAKDLQQSGAIYAYLLDRTLTERKRGTTIELGFVGFETENKRINLIDAPGHQEFMRNMISGAANADAAALMVDVTDKDKDLISSQMWEHLSIAYVFGIEQMVILINKMDQVKYSQKRYEEIKNKIVKLLAEVGFENTGKFNYIPLSAFNGENVFNSSKNMKWYSGQTFTQVIDRFKEPARILNYPLRMPILRTFSLPDVGTVIAGKIESGRVKIGDKIAVSPVFGSTPLTAEVSSIEWQHKKIDSAEHGMDIGLALGKTGGAFAKRQIKKGYIITDANHTLPLIKKLKAEILILEHPTKVSAGYSPVLHCHQSRLPCKIINLEAKLDRKTNKIIEKNPKGLKKGERAIVWIEPQKSFVTEDETKVPKLGRFALRDSNITVAAGRILEIKS